MIEAGTGLALWLVPGAALDRWVALLASKELVEDPGDPLAHQVLRLAQGIAAEQHFYAFYLLAHGAVKLLVVALLARGRTSAYPFALAMMGGFIAYQLYRFVLTGAWSMIALSVLDAAIIALTVQEWRNRSAART